MSDPVKTPSPKPELTRIPVAHIYFVNPFDFPHAQESNITCKPEIDKANRCYVAFYIPAWHQFEVTSAAAGEVQAVRMIPMEQIKSWVKA